MTCSYFLNGIPIKTTRNKLSSPTITLSLLALLFCEAKAKFLHPKFKGMILEKRFDESKGEIVALISIQSNVHVQWR